MLIVNINENIHAMAQTIVTDFLRDILNLCNTEFITGSIIPIMEVIPAKKMTKKNNGAKTCPIGPLY